MDNICSAFGHREVYQNIEKEIDKVIIELIEKHNINTFFTGGIGEFDRLFSSSVRRAQKNRPDIKLILVKPYFSGEINRHKSYYQNHYTSVIVPEEIIGVHYKSAITKRNKWMIDNSSYCIFYVSRDFGGAYTAMKYAEKKNKLYINLGNKQTSSRLFRY